MLTVYGTLGYKNGELHWQPRANESVQPTQPKLSRSRTIHEKDINTFASISIVDAAENMLQSCDIPDPKLKARLAEIRDELIKFKIELKENIADRYGE